MCLLEKKQDFGISDRIILFKNISKLRNSMGSELRVGDIMTKKVITVPFGTTIGEVAKLMKKNNIGSVIIVDDEQEKHAKGIITERDIIHKILASEKDPYDTPADKIMSKPLRVVEPETTIEEAAKAMEKNHIKRLPVVNQKNELIGILSEGDIMRIFPAVVDLIEEKASLS